MSVAGLKVSPKLMHSYSHGYGSRVYRVDKVAALLEVLMQLTMKELTQLDKLSLATPEFRGLQSLRLLGGQGEHEEAVCDA